MMSEQKKEVKIFKLLQILVILLFIAGVAVIGLYPFQSRDLSLDLIGENGITTVFLSREDIASGGCAELVINSRVAVKTVRVYGGLKSLRLMEFNANKLYSYIEDRTDIILEDGVIILPAGDIVLHMNEEFVEQMTSLSKSYLQERVIYAGIWTCLISLLFILLVVVKDWKLENRWDNHSPLYEFRKFGQDMKKYYQYMVYAAKANLKAEVANSYLNRLWWLLEPFFNMLVYVIVFGNIMGRSIENYATFVFSALLFWNFFSKTLNYSVKLMRSNKDIVTKVYVPKFILLFSDMILNLYKLAFSLVVLVPMLVIFRVHIGLNVIWIFPALITLILFSFGVGMILLHFGVYIDDLGYAVNILLHMMMFLSGIFYEIMSGLSYPLNSLMLCLNPVAMCIDTMRNALLYNTVANLPVLGVWFIGSLLICWLGVHIVYKNENSYVKVV